MAVFWVVVPCSLVEVSWRFRSACCPDDGGSKHLWNVGKLLPDYMAWQLRRQSSSYSLPWEPQISQNSYDLPKIYYKQLKPNFNSYNEHGLCCRITHKFTYWAFRAQSNPDTATFYILSPSHCAHESLGNKNSKSEARSTREPKR
jgi:hypothetical protein